MAVLSWSPCSRSLSLYRNMRPASRADVLTDVQRFREQLPPVWPQVRGHSDQSWLNRGEVRAEDETTRDLIYEWAEWKNSRNQTSFTNVLLQDESWQENNRNMIHFSVMYLSLEQHKPSGTRLLHSVCRGAEVTSTSTVYPHTLNSSSRSKLQIPQCQMKRAKVPNVITVIVTCAECKQHDIEAVTTWQLLCSWLLSYGK